jgi:hypothetical protein
MAPVVRGHLATGKHVTRLFDRFDLAVDEAHRRLDEEH